MATKRGIRVQKIETMASDSKILVSNKCPRTCKHSAIKQKREEVEQVLFCSIMPSAFLSPSKNVLSSELVIIVKKEISKV